MSTRYEEFAGSGGTVYREVASAPGAWPVIVQPPPYTPRREILAKLAAACTAEVPVSAAIEEFHGRIEHVALIRDPSIIHGTPSVDEYGQLAASLCRIQGWTLVPRRIPTHEVTVLLGLREGYSPDAVAHSRAEAIRLLLAHGAKHVQVPGGYFMSARRVGGAIQTYDEPAVFIHSTRSALPAVAKTADALAQHRFIVADRDQDRMYAMRRDNQPNETGGDQ